MTIELKSKYEIGDLIANKYDIKEKYNLQNNGTKYLQTIFKRITRLEFSYSGETWSYYYETETGKEDYDNEDRIISITEYSKITQAFYYDLEHFIKDNAKNQGVGKK